MTRRTRALSLILIIALLIPSVFSAAETHYGFNRNIAAGFRLGRAHEALDNAMVYLVAERDTMVQMRDGADCPSDSACYAAVTVAYGFSSNVEARGAFLELDSLCAKITTDASVSSVNAAITQFLSRLRS